MRTTILITGLFIAECINPKQFETYNTFALVCVCLFIMAMDVVTTILKHKND